MGDPKQGSAAWYKEAAVKLNQFTEKAKAYNNEGNRDWNAFTSETPEAETADKRELPDAIRKRENAKIQYDALNNG